MPALARADHTRPDDIGSKAIEKLIGAGAHREAVAFCAREYGATLGRLCMALLGAQAEAEEAVQETLLAAHSGMASYRAEGTVKAWLYGIARRICARRLETRIRRERRLVLVHDADADAELPDDLLEARRRAERVRAALEELKPSERDALLLRYESGLSYREIGHACGLDEATARKRASRALEKLGDILGSKETR
ncbi:MAG: sigma-70 family RNA polymerase sigma factor [Deltaproteobacteria bacterium]|nr:sigma-70 family RNA polymerase sigma factor [Deltaproteobacteria bacterium]